MASRPVLAVEGLTKHFGTEVAVDGVDLSLDDGEFLTLLGPSGCGKTTTIRMIGGYVAPSAGRILLDGKDITHEPPQRRTMGMVFQNYALFPHMTVRDNIAYPLKLRKWGRDRIDARVGEMLDIVRLPQIGQRHPSELSGGQQQRVALARALAFSPRVLLMDEALGALDAKLREQMQLEIRRIQQELRITTIHVTHDQDEALGMSDRVVVMRSARIAQVAAPRDLYEAPASAYVADFVGRINLLPARVVAVHPETVELELDVPDLLPESSRRVEATRRADHAVGTRVQVGIRPESMATTGRAADANSISGSVQSLKFSGALEYLTVRISPTTSVLAIAGRAGRPDGTIHLSWPPDKALVLAEDR